LVCFYNSQEEELPSNVLKVESALASILSDVKVPVTETVAEARL
jgi:hypothetical protein